MSVLFSEGNLPAPPPMPRVPESALERLSDFTANVEQIYKQRCIVRKSRAAPAVRPSGSGDGDGSASSLYQSIQRCDRVGGAMVNATVGSDGSAAIATTIEDPFTPPQLEGATRTATWMGDLGADVIGHVPFGQLKMVGTHNSGTSAMGRHSALFAENEGDGGDGHDDFTHAGASSSSSSAATAQSLRFSSGLSGGPKVLSGDGTSAIVKLPWGIRHIATAITAPWAKTQSLSLYEQLEAGYRYLDIRLITNDEPWKIERGNFDVGELWVAHGLFSIPHRRVVNECLAFARRYPKEVFVLDYNRLIEMNEDGTDDVPMGDAIEKAHRRFEARRALLFGGDCGGSPSLQVPRECLERQSDAIRYNTLKKREFRRASMVQPCACQADHLRVVKVTHSGDAGDGDERGAPPPLSAYASAMNRAVSSPTNRATTALNTTLNQPSFVSVAANGEGPSSSHQQVAAAAAAPLTTPPSSSQLRSRQALPNHHSCPYAMAQQHHDLFEDDQFGCSAFADETPLRRMLRDLQPLLPHIIPTYVEEVEEVGERVVTADPRGEGAPEHQSSHNGGEKKKKMRVVRRFIHPSVTSMSDLWNLPATPVLRRIPVNKKNSNARGNHNAHTNAAPNDGGAHSACCTGDDDEGELFVEYIKPSIIVTFPRHVAEWLQKGLMQTRTRMAVPTAAAGNTTTANNSHSHDQRTFSSVCARRTVPLTSQPISSSSALPYLNGVGGAGQTTSPTMLMGSPSSSAEGGGGGAVISNPMLLRGSSSSVVVVSPEQTHEQRSTAVGFMASLLRGVFGTASDADDGSDNHHNTVVPLPPQQSSQQQQQKPRDDLLDQEWHNRRTPRELMGRIQWYLVRHMVGEVQPMVAKALGEVMAASSPTTSTGAGHSAVANLDNNPLPSSRNRIFVTGAIITIGPTDIVRAILTGCLRCLASPSCTCINRPKYNHYDDRRHHATHHDDGDANVPSGEAAGDFRRPRGASNSSDGSSGSGNGTFAITTPLVSRSERSATTRSGAAAVPTAASTAAPTFAGVSAAAAEANAAAPPSVIRSPRVPPVARGEYMLTSANSAVCVDDCYFDDGDDGDDGGVTHSSPPPPSVVATCCNNYCGGSIFHVARELNDYAVAFFSGMNTPFSSTRWAVLTATATVVLRALGQQMGVAGFERLEVFEERQAKVSVSGGVRGSESSAGSCGYSVAELMALFYPSSNGSSSPSASSTATVSLASLVGADTDTPPTAAPLPPIAHVRRLLATLVIGHWGTMCACGGGGGDAGGTEGGPCGHKWWAAPPPRRDTDSSSTAPRPRCCLWCRCNYDRNVLQLDYAEDANLAMVRSRRSKRSSNQINGSLVAHGRRSTASSSTVQWEESAVEVCLRSTIAHALATKASNK